MVMPLYINLTNNAIVVKRISGMCSCDLPLRSASIANRSTVEIHVEHMKGKIGINTEDTRTRSHERMQDASMSNKSLLLAWSAEPGSHVMQATKTPTYEERTQPEQRKKKTVTRNRHPKTSQAPNQSFQHFP